MFLKSVTNVTLVYFEGFPKTKQTKKHLGVNWTFLKILRKTPEAEKLEEDLMIIDEALKNQSPRRKLSFPILKSLENNSIGIIGQLTSDGTLKSRLG